MTNLSFNVNPSLYLGENARKNLVYEIKKHKFSKAFIVTDKSLVKFKITNLVLDEVNKANISYDVFEDIVPNPSIENVVNGVKAFKASGADFIIAVGGGSVIDTAKCIAIVAKNKENMDIVSLEGIDKAKNSPVFLIAFPTTSGTGSETTMDFVISNLEEERKMSCMDSRVVPKIAILDADLTKKLPAKITAATTMDALTHAIESYICKNSNILSQMYSIKAIKLIGENLYRVLEDLEDVEARNNLALASYLAGVSFTNVGLGIVHSLAHPLSAHHHISHGEANALMLPFAMEYNLDMNIEQFSHIGKALGVKEENDKLSMAKQGISKIRDMLKKSHLSLKLSDFLVKLDDLEVLSKDAFSDVSTLDNKKEAKIKDFYEIYKKAL